LKDAAGRERGDGLSDSLMEAISDPDPGVREIALKTLGEISGEESVVLILESLHDPDPRVRAAAAAAAARTGSPTSIFSLILLLHDREIEVRQQAKSAIEAITGKTVDFDPSDPSQARRKKVESLQNWWKDERFAKLSGELKIALKEWKNK
jgi:HEAT repeat protein